MKVSKNRRLATASIVATLITGAGAAVDAQAQAPASPAAPEPKAAAPAAPGVLALDQLGWLRGCWSGKVDRREFTETWLAASGGMMLGISQTIVQDRRHPEPRTQDYTYLRLETRDDGVYYVAVTSGKTENAFKLSSIGENLGRTAYTFTNVVDAFPQKIVYLRGAEGWLYAQVTGKVGDAPKEVTYPMRHVDCMTGATMEN
jgi:hypothetical protein